ncbi:MAG TPA: proton-conducting transporter membrane subunit, partial [Candidatus Synoicihabitans sp.]|nr:proton-conducting transporter membrane subunit [Candidatus Synoicihabitans sp.]
FPLHLWLPDVYGSAVSSSAALIAPIGTKVAAYVLIRMLFYVMDPDWVRFELALTTVIGWMGAIGIVWGSCMAIAQADLRRMLAYSSVSQIGYIALGIGLGNASGFIGAVLHALNHAVMKSCLFLVASNLQTAGRTPTIDQLDDSLRRAMPWTAAAFTIAALSMIGLPPLAGFFSKWYLLLGSWEQAHWTFVVVIIASSLLNAVYFFRVIERLYLPRPLTTATDRSPASVPRSGLVRERRPSLILPAVTLAGGLILLGFANVAIVRRFIEPMLPPGF